MDNIKRINILYQFDEKYAPYASISMVSVFENNKDNDIRIYCAAWNVSQATKDKVELQADYYNKRIEWLETDNAIAIINSMDLGTWNGSLTTWIKMFIIDELPSDVKTLLYLDCDTLVERDLSSIIAVDLTDYYVAAAYDSVAQKYAKEIGTEAYYNAGVMYINAEKWKHDQITMPMLVHLKDNVATYYDNDQRLLNDYFRNSILLLPPSYNYQSIYSAYSPYIYNLTYRHQKYYSTDELISAQNDPIVLHFFRFLGDYPWEAGNVHPFKEKYNYWKNKSIWYEYKDLPRKKEAKFVIEKTLYHLLPPRVFLSIFKMMFK